MIETVIETTADVTFIITNTKGIQFECHVDEIDADLLTLFWHTHSEKNSDLAYVVRNTQKHPHRRTERMHTVIMERILGRKLEVAEKVDHKDRNGLNNTRSNLRVATHSQNMANKKVQSTNRLGIKGVRKRNNGFEARIGAGGKPRSLGLFPTVEEARDAYLEAARECYGEFARGGSTK